MTQSMRNPREISRNQEEPNEPKQKKKKRSKMFIIIPLVVVLLVIGFFAYAASTQSFMFAEEGAQVIEEEIFEMDEFVLNLKDDTGRRYLKTKMVLSYGEKNDLKILEENIAQIRDEMIGILRAKTPDEMMDVDKTEELKVEIKEAINTLLMGDIVLDVYFIDLMIQ